jgi:hypothetical protein
MRDRSSQLARRTAVQELQAKFPARSTPAWVQLSHTLLEGEPPLTTNPGTQSAACHLPENVSSPSEPEKRW